MKYGRTVIITAVLLGVFSGFLFSGGKPIITHSASVDNRTEKEKEEMKKRQAEVIAALDLTVEIEGKPRSFSSGSFDLPDGRLHYYENAYAWVVGLGEKEMKEELRKRKESKEQKLMLKFAFIKRKEDEKQKWLLEDPKPGFDLKKGYSLVYGEDKLKEAIEKVKKGEHIWIIQDELGLFRESAVLSQRGQVADVQLKKARERVEQKKKKLLDLYNTYVSCKKEKTEEKVKMIFTLFQELTDNKSRISLLESPMQRMLLMKSMMKRGSGSGFFEDEMGDVTYSSSRGRFNATVKIFGVNAGKYLPYFLSKVLGETLGKEVKCDIDAKLKSKTIKGKITFRSPEEGLDKLAKKIGGKLEKNKDGSYSIK